MSEIPIIRLRLEGVRRSIEHAFLEDSDDFNAMVANGLKHALSAENLQDRINEEVLKAVDNAIASLSKGYEIKSIITSIVHKALQSYEAGLEKKNERS